MIARDPAADARHTLSAYWSDSAGDLRFPVDPIRIARSLGAEVYLADLAAGVSGTLIADGARRDIYLSRANGPQRQRFTCAHEIGHLVDRTKHGGPTKFTDYRDGRSSQGIDPTEIYANQFAAELLMPAEFVRKGVTDGLTTEELAARFGVSQAAMSIRRDALGCK